MSIPELLQKQYNATLEASTLTPEQQAEYAAKIVHAYRNCQQKVAPPHRSKAGHVRVELIGYDEKEKEKWRENALNRLVEVVDQLLENKYTKRNIAVLVRTRAEGEAVANKLLAAEQLQPHGIAIISDDALLVGSSPAVRFVASVMYFLTHPDDTTAERMAIMAYTVVRQQTDTKEQPSIVLNSTENEHFEPDTGKELQRLSHRPLYEMAEGVFRLFCNDFPDGEMAFLQSFLDLAAEHEATDHGNSAKFLDWWNETGKLSKIAMPESQDAIRILTIHKSKGLDFDAVMIPFADWGTEPHIDTIIWCKPLTEPFNALHLVPTGYSSALNKTHFAEDFYHERLHSCVDNLNALYVALTRARETMIIFTPDHPSRQTHDLSQLIRTCLESNYGQRETGVYEWGDWWHPEAKTKSDTAPEEVTVSKLPSIVPYKRIHLLLRPRGGDMDDKQRQYGLLMHDILSHVKTADDIDSAVRAQANKGVISHSEADTLVKHMRTLVTNEKTAAWFDGSMEVLNEVDILFGDGQSGRPDRVMRNQNQVVVVDYKFGEKKNAHIKQIRHYRYLIEQMGYKNVDAFLWYVKLDEVIQARDLL
jgi:ATP-dependent exoDNAse (exonuclease V) beta subunit